MSSVECLNDISNLQEGGSMENNHETKPSLKVSKKLPTNDIGKRFRKYLKNVRGDD